MSFETLLLDVSDDGVGLVTINRPDKLNALNAAVIDDLDAVFREIESDDAILGVIVTGAGEKSFVAGADIRQFTELDMHAATEFAIRGQAVFARIEKLGKPVVAAVNGFALGGGCELALACHLRLAADTARFGQPEVGLGLIPGYGGTQRLPRVVGLGLAAELILTGAHVTADRAYEIGLVNRVVPAADLLDEARKLMGVIVKQAPVALRLALRALQSADRPLELGLAIEADLFGRCFDTEDISEGVSAFLERRKPSFKGR